MVFHGKLSRNLGRCSEVQSRRQRRARNDFRTKPCWGHGGFPCHAWGCLIIWLVVQPPLWKIWKSIGMMTFPIIGDNKKWQPNHQPVIFEWKQWNITVRPPLDAVRMSMSFHSGQQPLHSMTWSFKIFEGDRCNQLRRLRASNMWETAGAIDLSYQSAPLSQCGSTNHTYLIQVTRKVGIGCARVQRSVSQWPSSSGLWKSTKSTPSQRWLPNFWWIHHDFYLRGLHGQKMTYTKRTLIGLIENA